MRKSLAAEVGIIFLALPISVLGSNFEIVYEKYKEAMGGNSQAFRHTRIVQSLASGYSPFPRWQSARLISAVGPTVYARLLYCLPVCCAV